MKSIQLPLPVDSFECLEYFPITDGKNIQSLNVIRLPNNIVEDLFTMRIRLPSKSSVFIIENNIPKVIKAFERCNIYYKLVDFIVPELVRKIFMFCFHYSELEFGKDPSDRVIWATETSPIILKLKDPKFWKLSIHYTDASFIDIYAETYDDLQTAIITNKLV